MTICHQLKRVANGKKTHVTNVAVEVLLQLVQSVSFLVHDQPVSVPPGTDGLQKVLPRPVELSHSSAYRLCWE